MKRAAAIVLWMALGLIVGLELLYHASHLFFPHLLVASEDGLYMSARAYQNGWDPWAPERAFEYSNNYGLLLPWLAASLAPAARGAQLLLVLRLLNAAGALLALGLLYRVLRQGKAERLSALAACASIYAVFLYFDTLTARPDALALGCYVAAVALALRGGRWAGPLAGAVAVLGALAKQYALLGAPVAVLLLWAQGRRRDALLAAATAALMGALTLAWVLHVSPSYLEGTYYVLGPAVRYSWAHLGAQHWQMAQTHAPLLLLAVGGLGWLLWRRQAWAPQGAARAWAWAVLAVWVALALGPGRHLGAYLRYYHQLFLPLAIVGLGLWALQRGLPRWILSAALLADAASMMAYNLHQFPLQTLSPAARQEWAKAATLAEAFPDGGYPPAMTPMVEAQAGRLLSLTDHSRHFRLSSQDGPARRAVLAQAKHTGELLKARRLPVILSSEVPEIEQLGYRLVDRICLESPLMPASDECLAIYKAKP